MDLRSDIHPSTAKVSTWLKSTNVPVANQRRGKCFRMLGRVTETSFLLSTEAQAGSSDQRAIWGWGRSLSCVSIPSLSALHPPTDNWKWRHFLLKECVISNRPSLGPALKADQTRWERRWSGNLSPEGINDFRNNSDCCSLGHGKSPQLWSGRPSSSWDGWNFFLRE